MIHGLIDRHGGGQGQDVDEHARVGGVEVLDQDKGQTGIGRQGAKELSESLEPSGGSANGDDWKGGTAVRPAFLFDHRLLPGVRRRPPGTRFSLALPWSHLSPPVSFPCDTKTESCTVPTRT